MVNQILEWLALQIMGLIQFAGYWGVFFLMALESANIPIPSEIIMPFSGFLVSKGVFGFWPVAVIGALGNLFGSVVSYLLAAFIVKNRHKFYPFKLLIPDSFLEKAERFFKKYGSASVFFSRMLPVVRTFISLPAGLGKMNFLKFCSLTFLGSLVWSFVLAYFGKVLGDNWMVLEKYFRQFDVLILAVIIGAGVYWLSRHFSRSPR
jgi:membrane protein DedA with SNARE-associated domain